MKSQFEFVLTVLPISVLIFIIVLGFYFECKRRKQKKIVETFLKQFSLKSQNENCRKAFTLSQLSVETKCSETDILNATMNNPKIGRIETINPEDGLISEVQFYFKE